MAAGYLIGPCFPCITKLTLKAVNLEHGEVLSGLLCSRVPLSCLKLTHCSMSASVVPALAALLTTLPLKVLEYVVWGAGVSRQCVASSLHDKGPFLC
jgi:hypothetical protein